LIIADTAKGYTHRIHTSLITDNHFEVVDGKFEIPDSLYEAWFGQCIREERSRAFREACDLFNSHIPLFIQKQDIILHEPRFYGVVMPTAFFEVLYLPYGNSRITLGELLKIWGRESWFQGVCPRCGGRAMVTHFGGSLLSGTIMGKSGFCVDCRELVSLRDQVGSKGLGSIIDRREKYRPIQPIAPEPASVAELVAFLEGRKHEAGNETARFENVETADIHYTVGGKKISRAQWVSMTGARSVNPEHHG
jgi:hypothetical protein